MKNRILALLITGCLAFSIVACGNESNVSGEGKVESNQSDATEKEEGNNQVEEIEEVEEDAESENEIIEEAEETADNWQLVQEVDDFGDPVESDFKRIMTSVEGTFSNTATSGSDLSGAVYVYYDTTENYCLQYSIGFSLMEYGTTKAVYSNNEGVLKTKAGDVKGEYRLNGYPPNDDMILSPQVGKSDGIKNVFAAGNDIVNALYKGEDVRCIIEMGNSKYDFTIGSKDFYKAFTENGFTQFSPVEKAKRLLLACRKFMNGDFSYSVWYNYYNDVMENKIELNTPVMTEEEINEKINGNFLTLSRCYKGATTIGKNKVEYRVLPCSLVKYEKGTCRQIGNVQTSRGADSKSQYDIRGPLYLVEGENAEFVDIDGAENSYTVSGDTFSWESLDRTVQLRELADGIYQVVYSTDENGYDRPPQLLIKYDGAHQIDALNQFLEEKYKAIS